MGEVLCLALFVLGRSDHVEVDAGHVREGRIKVVQAKSVGALERNHKWPTKILLRQQMKMNFHLLFAGMSFFNPLISRTRAREMIRGVVQIGGPESARKKMMKKTEYD